MSFIKKFFSNDGSTKIFTVGGSGGPQGVSVGTDIVANLEGDVVGGNVTAGVGAGTPLEGHVRIGVTGMVSFKDIMALIWSGDE
ncbi:MAG TPA: hypothetical protein VLZ44_09520 [Treponemataceae bacterium]|nr:hypothetical protein [Treponemataceae bacterium]